MNKFKSTVVQTLTDSGDIFYVGNIVVWSHIIVIVTGVTYNGFYGTIVKHDVESCIGCNEEFVDEGGFKQFHGSITLDH